MWVHQLDPFAFQISGDFGLRWYGLAYLAGFLFCYFAIAIMAKTGRIGLKFEQVSDFVTVAAVGAMLGGRLGYGLFYRPDLFAQWGDSFPYWGILEVHKGGMASHGGILGVILACIIYGHRHKISKFQLIDLAAMSAGVGLFFGRLANFINGELFGRVTQPHWYTVQFPQEMYRWLQEARLEKLKQLAPLVEKISPISVGQGQSLVATNLTWQSWVDGFTSSGRQNIENYISHMVAVTQSSVHKNHSQVIEGLGSVLSPRHPSQIYQGLMEGLFVFLFLFFIWRKPQKAGVISGWFALSYSVVRIIGEQFRLPDAHLGYGLWSLTRGQWLSVGLLVFSFYYLFLVYKSSSLKVGGWRSH